MTLDDSDIFNQGNETTWQYDNSIESSLTIFDGSLQSNQIYQFKVYLENLQDSSLQAIGYLSVQVQNTYSHLINIELVILLRVINS